MAIDLNGKKLPKGIHQRPNGLYVGRFKYQNKSYVFYNRDLEQLQKTLDDKRYEVRHELYFRENNITVDAWFHTWMKEYKTDLKVNSVYTYEQVYKLYIKPTFGNRRLKDVKSGAIQSLINRLFAEGKSRSRVNIVYVVLLGMYKKAVMLNMVARNPLSAVEFPKNKTKREMRVMTLEEQRTFLKYAKNSRYFDIYMMALCTGMRIGEILALRWNDINFPNHTLQVNGTLVYISSKNIRFIDQPKSMSSHREIPLLESIELLLRNRQILRQQYLSNPSGIWQEKPGLENMVFVHSNGSPYWDGDIRTELYKILKQINQDGIPFEKITPHTFRHTFATRGLENGIPPKVMQSILGHSSLAITMDKYSHVLPDTKAQEMAKLNLSLKV